MILPIVLGALFGAGLLASWRLLFPSPPPLQAAIDRLQRRNTLASLPAQVQGQGMTDLLGRTVGVSVAPKTCPGPLSMPTHQAAPAARAASVAPSP